jgi:hypothetical protein
MNSPHSSTHALLSSFLSSFSRARRLEDRIRKLCADALTSVEPAEFDRIMERLKIALHDHASRVRQMAVAGRFHSDRRKPAVD